MIERDLDFIVSMRLICFESRCLPCLRLFILFQELFKLLQITIFRAFPLGLFPFFPRFSFFKLSNSNGPDFVETPGDSYPLLVHCFDELLEFAIILSGFEGLPVLKVSEYRSGLDWQ